MKVKLLLIIAMFLSGTGVLAEELPTLGLTPVNKITHPFFFQYLEDLTYNLYVNYRPPRFFPTDFCEIYVLTIQKDGSFDDTSSLSEPSLGMIKSVVKPFYPQMNYDELRVDISLCKTKDNDIYFNYYTKDNSGDVLDGLVTIKIYKDYRQVKKKPKDKEFIYKIEKDINKNFAIIIGKLKNAYNPDYPF